MMILIIKEKLEIFIFFKINNNVLRKSLFDFLKNI